MKKIILFFIIHFVLPFNLALAHPKAVVLLRHGEEPEEGNELSAEGWARAKILPLMFKTHPVLKELGKPDFLFAAGAKKSKNSIRSIQTLQPLAASLNILVNDSINRDDVVKLADEINSNPIYDGKLIVIAWQHTLIPVIADYLGIKKKKLPEKGFPDQYDRIWLITYETKNDNKVKEILNDYPQDLMPHYEEALNQAFMETTSRSFYRSQKDESRIKAN